MRTVRRFGQFWYDFVVGDDWMLALGVVVAVGLTGLLARVSGAAWVVMPVAVTVLLAVSIGRAQRSGRKAQ